MSLLPLTDLTATELHVLKAAVAGATHAAICSSTGRHPVYIARCIAALTARGLLTKVAEPVHWVTSPAAVVALSQAPE